MKGKGLLNYTTSIDVGKTLGEIQRLLVSAGASHILTEYDNNAFVSSVAFKCSTQFGVMSFQLPCKVSAVLAVLERQARQGKIPRKYIGDEAQARRVGWRIVLNWLEAQLAFIETEMVTLDQVMLSYAQSTTGETMYERMTKTKEHLLLE